MFDNIIQTVLSKSRCKSGLAVFKRCSLNMFCGSSPGRYALWPTSTPVTTVQSADDAAEASAIALAAIAAKTSKSEVTSSMNRLVQKKETSRNRSNAELYRGIRIGSLSEHRQPAVYRGFVLRSDTWLISKGIVIPDECSGGECSQDSAHTGSG